MGHQIPNANFETICERMAKKNWLFEMKEWNLFGLRLNLMVSVQHDLEPLEISS